MSRVTTHPSLCFITRLPANCRNWWPITWLFIHSRPHSHSGVPIGVELLSFLKVWILLANCVRVFFGRIARRDCWDVANKENENDLENFMWDAHHNLENTPL